MSLRQSLVFAKNFLRYPKLLGSVVPSSPFLVNHLLSFIDWEKVGVVVEYGPGVGTVTAEILKRIPSSAVLVVIELNPEFARMLKAQIRDPRLRVVHGSATDVHRILESQELERADCIISGIPFTGMPESVRDHVLLESRRALDPEGVLLVYQFTRTVLPHLKSVFRNVEEDFNLLNILPARIFYCSSAVPGNANTDGDRRDLSPF
jgi:phospholipid N-methyltransferase